MTVELAAGSSKEYRFTLKGHAAAKQKVAADDGRVEVQLRPKRTQRDTSGDEPEDPFKKVDDLKEDPF